MKLDFAMQIAVQLLVLNAIFSCKSLTSKTLSDSITSDKNQEAFPINVDGTAGDVLDEDRLHELRLIVDTKDLDEEEQAIGQDAKNLQIGKPSSKKIWPAKLNYDGEDIGEIGFRHKGSFGTLGNCFDAKTGDQLCKKFSYSLYINFTDPTLRLGGLKSLNLHSESQDPTLMHEVLAYKTFRAAGIPASRSAFVRVYINDQYKGLYAGTEFIDDLFVANRWPQFEEGELYEDAWPNSENASTYDSKLRKPKAGQKTSNHATLVNFSRDLAAEDKADAVRRYMDPDYIARYLVVDSWMNNWDGITRFYCGTSRGTQDCYNHNFFLFTLPSANRVWMIPWDLDGTWDSRFEFVQKASRWDVQIDDCQQRFVIWGGYHMPAACDRLFQGFISLGENHFHQIREQLMAGPLSAANLLNMVDAWRTLIEPAVIDDKGVDAKVWQSAFEKFRLGLSEQRVDGYPPCLSEGHGKTWKESGYIMSKDADDLSPGSICWLKKN